MQLTPTFKMSGLQLKPTSKVVSMRLAPLQDPEPPPMNLQVTFEVAKIDLVGGTIATIRLVPSAREKPAVLSSPSFAISGFQLVSGAGPPSVQVTPSHQEQASVYLTAHFQIAAIEFTPLFEISSIVLKATTRNVFMQLPSSGPSSIDSAPGFEIESVELAANGTLGMIGVTSLCSESRVSTGRSMSRDQAITVSPAPVLIDISANLSKDQDLDAFRNALRNYQDLLQPEARRIRINFELPKIRSFDDFVERFVAEGLRAEPIDIGPWLGRYANINFMMFFAAYPSGHIRPILVNLERQNDKILLTFPDPVVFLDPAAHLEDSQLSGLKGEFDLLPLELPPT